MTKTSHDSETAAQGQQVITACAFIHHTLDGVEKVLLPRRADTKKFLPGIYELPGGHIDYGEHIVDGLKREIMEELGIEITVGDPFATFDYTNKLKGSHSVEIVYFATLISPLEKIRFDPDDHSSCDWFAKEELHLVHNDLQDREDAESAILQKGFMILGGNGPDTTGS